MSIFSQAGMKSYPSSQFDLSHDVKLTCRAGYLIPINCIEMLPGDTINISQTIMARLMPMLAPIMHKVDITITHHAVPIRLLWEKGYERFFADATPTPDTPVIPYISDVQFNTGSLADYLGLPTIGVGSGSNYYTQYNAIDKILAFPFAAYQKIYDDWYRDQNLVSEVPYQLTDGDNRTNISQLGELRVRAWQHDYFTAALPWAQKGEAVEIPIANLVDVPVANVAPSTAGGNIWSASSSLGGTQNLQTANWPPEGDLVDPAATGSLYAQTSRLSSAAAITINALRWANKIQEFMEANARGGTRYIELVRHRFGVRSSDLRTQRSEFLGWSRQPIVMSEVLTTANTDDAVTGDMYGHGLSVGSSKRAVYRAEENGYFLSILSIRPKTSYSQGIHKMWSRFTNLDWAYPNFAHLGEQEVKFRELYYTDKPELKNGHENDETFGYMQRYAEYKYMDDRVAGEMRTSLDFWHMGRTFVSRPVLSQAFIECHPTTRIFAVTEGHHYVIHVSQKIKMWRVLPKHGIPSL